MGIFQSERLLANSICITVWNTLSVANEHWNNVLHYHKVSLLQLLDEQQSLKAKY